MESLLTGTEKIGMLISPRQDTSKNNYKNMNTYEMDHIKIVHIWLQPRSMEKLPKIPSPKTQIKNYQGQEKMSPTGYWKHVLLYTGHRHHTPHGTQRIAAEQSQATEFTMDTVEQLLVAVQ